MNENLNTTPDQEQPNKKPQDIGAVALTIANFQNRHKDIVDSSLEKARKKGEKLPGKNDERRNYAYLSRLENLIGKYGNEAEKRLWQASVNDDLLIKYANITDAYWTAKKQELRDNGYGNIDLTDDYKHELFNKERELQEESLQKWVNYLGDEHSPYPLWFKVYAWDGATKMGRYNKQKAKYEVRNETTVAPYPEPDAEVLGKVFETVNRYYGNGEKEFYTDEGERNIELEKIVQSGSFPKIYNAIQQDISPILEPPEKTEDVHGQWMEYGLGDEDDIARAAKGTGWCVASSSVGRHYLTYGTYGEDNDWDGEDNENYDEEYGLKSKFILFHLEDSKTGKISRNACASIRLDPDGQVAEISGLKEGQALNDSLVPIVEAKVKTLPGGEKFLEAFADKNELICLDRKMHNNEPLTKEELEFIYEIHRPIKTLDTYNENDPRIKELKEKYVEYALENGISVNQLVSRLDSDDIIDTLISHGLDINQLVSELQPYDIVDNLNTLINHGADINQLVSRLDSDDIIDNLDTFISHGVDIDINQLVSELRPYDIIDNLDTLINHGADINQLVSRLDSDDIIDNLDTLINHGADIDIDQLVSELQPYDIIDNLDTLINHGADINQLVSRLDSDYIAKNLDTIINHGADINQLVSKLSPYDIADNLDTLISHGADIDVNQLVSKLGSYDIIDNLDTLINHGADINQLVSRLGSYNIVENLDTLISHGADINQLVSRLNSGYIAYNLDTLISHGADIDINQLVSRLGPYNIVEKLDTLISHGADINQLVSELRSYDIADNLDTLISYGANINQLVSKLRPDYIADNLDAIISHGADIDINQLVSKLDSYDIADNLDTLISHGADINQLVSRLGSYNIAKNLDTLISYGADINQLVSELRPYDIVDNLDTLISHGADIDINQLVSKLDSYDIADNLDTLRAHGYKG